MSQNINKKFLQYSAVFEPAIEGGYNISFPSFPGCVTFGRTFEEAKIKAKEILELWIEELIDQNEKIPTCFSRPIIDEIQITAPAKNKIAYAPDYC